MIMANIRALTIIAVALSVGCTRHQPDQVRPRVPLRQEQRESEDGTKTFPAGPDQILVFRLVSPAKYRIDYPDFYVLETEVTNAQFKAFLDATGATKDDLDVLKIVRERD